MSYPFAKGHGTENDFVLLPDLDGSVHGDLPAERVRALCDRHAGIGGDGVLRVIRTAAVPDADEESRSTEWFMDYRNADGSIAQMCGNGLRVFVRYLLDEGLVAESALEGDGLPIGTRSGVKRVRVSDGRLSGGLGIATLGGDTTIDVGQWTYAARAVDVGNPHAVVFVDDLAEAGSLLEAPGHDAAVFPEGVNVEFVVRRAAATAETAGLVAMRVHERGVGETRSCGTGACAVMLASAAADRVDLPASYRVEVPGGTVTVSATSEGRVWLTGPAVIVASGTTGLGTDGSDLYQQPR